MILGNNYLGSFNAKNISNDSYRESNIHVNIIKLVFIIDIINTSNMSYV